MLTRPLLFALALSLFLHVAAPLAVQEALRHRPPPKAPARPAVQAILRLPPEAPALREPAPPEPILKNTIDADEAANAKPPVAPPPAAKPSAAPAKARATPREVRSAQRKLSSHLFYPQEAVDRGLEGEVRLIVRLSAEGHVDDVQIAAGSGHAILDNAAIKAAYAMGSLTGASARELIVPVIFRLQ